MQQKTAKFTQFCATIRVKGATKNTQNTRSPMLLMTEKPEKKEPLKKGRRPVPIDLEYAKKVYDEEGSFKAAAERLTKEGIPVSDTLLSRKFIEAGIEVKKPGRKKQQDSMSSTERVRLFRERKKKRKNPKKKHDHPE